MSSAEKDSREVGQRASEDSVKVEDSAEVSDERSVKEEASTPDDTAVDGGAEGENALLPVDGEDAAQVGSGDSGDGGDGGVDDGEEEPDEEEAPMTFLEHLEELRKRFIRIFIACIVGFLACYSFAKPLFSLLMAPLVAVLPENSTLIFTSLPEGFVTYLKVAFVAGIFSVSPYIFAQIWGFIAPGLYEHERKWMIPLAFLSAFFFVGGALFGYYVVFPFGCEFFMGFADEFIKPMPTLREYLGFSLKLLFAFGFIFELPLFIFFLARLGVVTAEGLRAKRKYAILVCFICSAILTPPDVMTQTLMAGPLIFLYEVGIWVAYFFGKRGGRKLKNSETDGGNDPDDSGPDGSSAKKDASCNTSEACAESAVATEQSGTAKEGAGESVAPDEKKEKDNKNKVDPSGYDEDMIEM